MHPINDVVVVIPGILGSTLERDGRVLWGPARGGATSTIKALAAALADLRLPNGLGDNEPDDDVVATAVMPDLHLAPGIWTHNLGYQRLIDRLHTGFELVEPVEDNETIIPNLLTFTHDWRLSHRLNALRLQALVEPALDRWRAQGGPCADAKLVFICHSTGGLIARWYQAVLGGAELTRSLISFGTPFGGSVLALEQLVNPVETGWGSFKAELAATVRSWPSMYQLLPDFACIEGRRKLAPISETELPELASASVADGIAFHQTLAESAAELEPSAIHAFVGQGRRTPVSAAVVGGRIVPGFARKHNHKTGDGAVTHFAATPSGVAAPAGSVSTLADGHGALLHHEPALRGLVSVLAEIERLPGAQPHDAKTDASADGGGGGGDEEPISVVAPEAVVKGESIEIELTGARRPLLVRTFDQRGVAVGATQQLPRDPTGRGRLVRVDGLDPGAYTIEVTGLDRRSEAESTVRTAVFVWEPALR